MQDTIEMSGFRRGRTVQGAGKQRQSVDQSRDDSSAPQLWDLKIAVLVPRDDDGERLIRELQRLRATVKHIWPMPPQIPAQFDVVFCALSSDLPQRLPWIPGEPGSTLVVVDQGEEAIDLKLLHNCAADAVLHCPVRERAVQAALSLARSHFLYERRLRSRIGKLDESLRTMSTVERAKSLLMRTKNMSEEEAYKFLRQQAMERRVTIGALATAIIDSYELLS